MLRRSLTPLLRDRLATFPAVALLGPRQVGKTTLARSLASDLADGKEVLYLDLENPADLAKLEDAPGYLHSQHGRLVILDEVHRAPGLFGTLRGVIDERLRAGERAAHFLLLGSASIDLMRQSSESLAGRIAHLELAPFDVLEVAAGESRALWVRGGFPPAFLADSEAASVAWRAGFLATYLERDIPQLARIIHERRSEPVEAPVWRAPQGRRR
ncbi:MAG: hypothetical protein DWQ36_07000 [Acidobacteria bacterium]|nr:MAG: hypothetical protein DWQ30_24435 [Acidobacteriota bacterium]REK09289.1 MAG: hypothetical protein DWQ36_07000 [Acidobacteriota bacterium]